MKQSILPTNLKALLTRYHKLTPEVIDFLHIHLHHSLIPAKTLLQKQGKHANKIYFIESGLLHSLQTIDNKEQTTWFMKEGDVAVSIEGFFLQEPSVDSIQTIEPCSVYYIGFKHYTTLCNASHSFCNTARQLTEQYYIMAEKRNRLLRIADPKRRLEMLESVFPDISLRCPLRYIASYLGITQATLSRIRSRRNNF